MGLAELIREAVASSLWPLTLGLDYATLELFSVVGPRYDIGRFGGEVFRPSPRQTDVLICAGCITRKMAPVISGLHEAMAEPRFVVAVGAGAISGAPLAGSYNVVPLHEVVPVDVYVPGDPPRPEAIIDGLLALSEQIRSGKTSDPATLPRYHPERWPYLYSAMVDAGLGMQEEE